MNMLQILGLQSPGVVSDDDYGGDGDYSGAAPVAPPQNVLQGVDPAGLAASPAAMPVPQPAAPEAAPTRPARSRSSLLDHIGRVADVLAQVGGAAPLYQPTLDVRQDRVLTLGDHDRAVTTTGLQQDLTRQQIAEGRGKALISQNTLATAAVKRLHAIVAANPNADVGKIWGLLGAQAGLPAEQTAALGQIFTADPSAIEAMASAADKDDEKYSGNVVYATGPDGVLHAFQAGVGSNSSRDILPPGYTAADPIKVVNTGGATVLTGTHSPQRILPNTEAPGRAEDRQSRKDIAYHHDATTVEVAGMPARAKPNDKGKGNGASSLAILDDLQRDFDALHGMKALPGDNGGVVGNVLGALGRTRVGQAIGEQAGSPAAQRRIIAEKNISLLQQQMVKDLPAAATRTKFEQERLLKSLPDAMRSSYETGNQVIRQLRNNFQRAWEEERARTGSGTRTPVRPTLRTPVSVRPRGAASKPTVSNW